MQHSREAYDLKSFSELFSIGRTKLYQEIKEGKLKILKVGRRTIITAQAADEWLASLPAGGRNEAA